MLAGCGGGYDVFGAVPLYFDLKERSKEVFLASLSFTDFNQIVNGSKTNNHYRTISAESKFLDTDVYSPEYYLSKWFKDELNEDIDIYSFPLLGAQPLGDAYRSLYEKLGFDTVILVDGGTDSLLQGDEYGLGTYIEDLSSLLAVNSLKIPQIRNKIIISVGFGIDAHHGVSHYDILSNIADIIQRGGFLGSFSLENTCKPVERYIDAVRYVNTEISKTEALDHETLDRGISIVQNSIISALGGNFGSNRRSHRTESGGSDVSSMLINPLMGLMWCFKIPVVCDLLKCTPTLSVLDTMEDMEVMLFQQRGDRPGHTNMPIEKRRKSSLIFRRS